MINQYLVREISRELDADEVWVKFECLTHNVKSDEISRTIENCPEECLPPLVRPELLGKVSVSRDLCRSWSGGRFV